MTTCFTATPGVDVITTKQPRCIEVVRRDVGGECLVRRLRYRCLSGK